MENVSARDVGNYFVRRMRERGENISSLKLQKLVYYAQAWSLALHGAALFPERIEAWLLGPVVPSLFGDYNQRQWQPIEGEVPEPTLSHDLQAHLDEVLDAYGDLGARELEQLSRTEAPWLRARRGVPKGEPSTAVIDFDSMESYYRSVLDA